MIFCRRWRNRTRSAAVPAGRPSTCWPERRTARSRRRALLRQEPFARRIRVRSRLGRGLRARRRQLLPEASGRRAVHAGDRPPAPGAARSACTTRVGRALASGLIEMCGLSGASGVHVTFATEPEYPLLGELGYLQRTDQQFHWENAGYRQFRRFPRRADARASARPSAASGRTRWQTASACIGSPAAISPRPFGTRSSSSTWRPDRANGAGPI